ncbi:hypothetical protein Esti_000412 [Eimeria stiedai]
MLLEAREKASSRDTLMQQNQLLSQRIKALSNENLSLVKHKRKVQSLEMDLEEAKAVIEVLKVQAEAKKTMKPFDTPVNTGLGAPSDDSTSSTSTRSTPSFYRGTVRQHRVFNISHEKLRWTPNLHVTDLRAENLLRERMPMLTQERIPSHSDRALQELKSIVYWQMSTGESSRNARLFSLCVGSRKMAEGQNLEDQENEMEALAALLPHEGEFTQLSPTTCIVRMVPFGERGRKDPLNRVMVGMRFEFTPDYPQEPPIWSFEDSYGFPEEELEDLRAKIEHDMKRNKGGPMIFSVAEVAVDWLRQKNDPAESMYDQMMNRKLASVDPALEDEKSVESPPTPRDADSRGPGERTLCAASERCTKQEFESWAAAFRTEMEERGIWKGSCAKGIVTGRQLFMEDGLGIAAAADEDGVDEPASKGCDKASSGPAALSIQAVGRAEHSFLALLILVLPSSGAAFWSHPGLFGQDAKDLPCDD